MKKSYQRSLQKTSRSGGCLMTIATLYPQLTRREKQIADYIRSDNSIIYQSITEFIRRSGVGYGTMMRFCRRLGCAGFQEFKIRMTQDLVQRQPSSSAGNNPLDAMAARVQAEISDTLHFLSMPQVAKAARALAGARQVLVAGCGGSAVTAHEIEYRLNRMGIPAAAFADSHMQRIRAAMLSARDVAFLVSASGSTKEILAGGAQAKQSGATVLGLTHFAESPLASLADIMLVAVSHADPLQAEIDSKITIDFVLDVLFQQLAQIKKDSSRCIAKTYQSVADRQY